MMIVFLVVASEILEIQSSIFFLPALMDHHLDNSTCLFSCWNWIRVGVALLGESVCRYICMQILHPVTCLILLDDHSSAVRRSLFRLLALYASNGFFEDAGLSFHGGSIVFFGSSLVCRQVQVE